MLMHAAIAKRLEKLSARGIDLGRDLDKEFVSGKETVHCFDYGQLRTVPGMDEAYFVVDGEHAWRFLQRRPE
jgi:hypothetical protein